MQIIEGSLKPDKTLCFNDTVVVNQSENNSTKLVISIPQSFEGYLVFLEFSSGSIGKYMSDQLTINENYEIEYILPAHLLRASGSLDIQLSLFNESDSSVVKSLLGESTLDIYPSINTSEYVIATGSCQIAKIHTAINLALQSKEQMDTSVVAMNALIADIISKKDTDLKGDRGEKGNPSSIDKVLIQPTSNISISDNEVAIIGSFYTPIELSQDTQITINNVFVPTSFQKSFILYIKRLADVAITWANVVSWAYEQPALLPVGMVQKIHIETLDGQNFFATAGDYFNV